MLKIKKRQKEISLAGLENLFLTRSVMGQNQREHDGIQDMELINMCIN